MSILAKAKQWFTINFCSAVAQMAHFGFGGYSVYRMHAWGASMTEARLIAAGIWAGKEIIESVWGVWEAKQPWSNAALDYTFFVLGILSTL